MIATTSSPIVTPPNMQSKPMRGTPTPKRTHVGQIIIMSDVEYVVRHDASLKRAIPKENGRLAKKARNAARRAAKREQA